MVTPSWRWSGRRSVRPARRVRPRLFLEPLETRNLPAPLAVASTSPPTGGLITLPTTTLTYSVTFNQPIDPATVSIGNLSVSQGLVTGASVQPNGQTVQYTIAALTTPGDWTVDMAAGAVLDPTDTIQLTQFEGHYLLDQPTTFLPLIAGVQPAGSLIYQANSSNRILFPGDSDKFTLSADPGQTLTVAVSPDAALVPSVQVTDPSGAPLGSGSAALPGQQALVQTIPTTTGGTYTFTVSGLAGTSGRYNIQVLIDAALEVAKSGQVLDGSLATAQNLDPSFVTLQTGVSSTSRGAVIGNVGQLTINASASGWWDSTGMQFANNPNYIVGQIVQANTTEYRNYFAFNLSKVNEAVLGAQLNLSNPSYNSPNPSDTYTLFDVTTPISSLVAPGSGQLGVFDDLGSGTMYGSQTVTTANNGQIVSTPFNSDGVTAVTNSLGGKFAVGGAMTTLAPGFTQYLYSSTGDPGETKQLVLNIADSRFYAFSLTAGDKASVGLNLSASGDTLAIEDSHGTMLASGGTGGANYNPAITGFMAPATGTYYIVISGSTAASYTLVVTRDGTLNTGGHTAASSAQDVTGTQGVVGALTTQTNPITPDWYQVTLNSTQSVLEVQTALPLSGPTQPLNTLNPAIQLFDASNNLIASGKVLSDGRNQSIFATGLLPGATYYISIGSANSAPGEYYLAVTPSGPPLVTTEPNSVTVLTGQPATFTAAASGSPAPLVQWEYSTDGGATYSVITGASSTTYTIPATTLGQNGNLYVAQFTNLGGMVASEAALLTVQAPPAFTSAAPPTTITAGQPYNFTFTASGLPAPTLSASNLPAWLSFNPATGVLSGTPTLATTYSNLQITATNAAGSVSVTFNLTVNPGPLSKFAITTGSSTVAGSGLLFTVQAEDASLNAVNTFGGTVTFSTTDPQGIVPAPAMLSGGFGVFLGNLKTVAGGPWTINAVSGTISGSSAPILVTPGPASTLGFVAQPLSVPTGVLLPAVTVQIQDPYGNVITTDSSDAVTLGVTSGPGSFLAGSTLTATASSGVATFNNLKLALPGSYTLSALVPGKYTGPNSSAFSILPLQVIPGSFTGSPSGFSLQFNAPFLVNSTTPVLFGPGFGSAAPAPSVIVTTDPGNLSDTAAIVEGSLILNTATSTITFVSTNTAYEANNNSPILPDGTYTVIVRASAASNGFQALNAGGGFLDGLGSGTPGSGDYTHTFVVNATAAGDAVLWVPATAEGPGQPLVAPGNNLAGGGYPLYLDSTGNVTKAFFTINYDPTLLTATGISGPHLSVLAGSFAGHTILEYTGPALAVGSQTPIGFLNATVPAGTSAAPTPYKAKNLIHLSAVTLNNGAVPSTTSDALHLLAYVGDADGNGAYSSADAVLVTRVGLQTDAGFAAYPLVDPVIVADTDGSGFIAADSPLQINEAGVNIPPANLTNPAVPSGVHFQAIPNNVDPAVSLPAHLQVDADGTLSVPVNLDDADPTGSTGLIQGHLALTYDPKLFTVSAAGVHPGSLLAGSGWSFVPSIDSQTGQIAIALSSTTAITQPLAGSLVVIDFHQIAASASPASIELVPTVNLGQQVVATELEDAQGTFTLTLMPTAVVTLAALPAAPLREVRGLLQRPGVTVSPERSAPGDRGAVSRAETTASALLAETTASGTPSMVPEDRVTFGNVPAVRPDLGIVQRALDQVYQALARSLPSAFDATLLGSSLQDLLQRSWYGQGVLEPPTLTSPNAFAWDGPGPDADGETSYLTWPAPIPASITMPASDDPSPLFPMAVPAEGEVERD
jgi:hypothetical protein